MELIVGIRRMLPMDIENGEIQLLLQRLLGQLLFYPPNVAGWPGGKNWIDSSSLMLRLRIPQMISDSEELAMKPKDDDDQMMGRVDAPVARKSADKKSKEKTAAGARIISSVDWGTYLKRFELVPREKLLSEISRLLLQTPSGITEETLKRHTDSSSRENFIKTTTIQLMSLPEYQMC